ncbi:hypothetical protein MHYP_G00157890 [Metynnis hypsauchen]
MEEKEADDKRMDFLKNYTLSSLKLTQDKWQEFLAVKENHKIVGNFFDQADVGNLIISRNAASQLVASLAIPTTLRNKAVSFLKRDKEVLRDDNIRNLYVGDLPASSVNVDVAIAAIEEVIYPLLTNRDNMKGWPKVVSEDVIQQTLKLKNEASVLGGLIEGRTVLPLPENAEVLEGTIPVCRLSDAIDSKLMHAFETVIIDWTHQISEVLKKDSAQPVLDELNPLPKAEFDFWNDRLKSLECIHEQLLNPKVQKMAEILETAESVYWPALRNIFKDVKEGLKEAENIILYLTPLQKRLDEMENVEYSLLPSHIKAVTYTVALTWANSEYYCRPERIIVILQEISNLLILKTENFLGPEEDMRGFHQKDEMLGKIRKAIVTLDTLRGTFDQCRLSMDRFFKGKKTKNWKFPSHLVFTRLDAFLQRLQQIELFER